MKPIANGIKLIIIFADWNKLPEKWDWNEFSPEKKIVSKLLLHNLIHIIKQLTSFYKPIMKNITVSIKMKNCRQFNNYVRERSYNDPLSLILKHEARTLTVVNLFSSG